ncbi:hypothetical protein [Aliiroseovarius sediminis]|uniref:hypothetical protein n=1 Tax=Aliiroseovarius sediminis TaxID=2925839 RepID=UPI001F56677B|nr:hypothetical protein [Aliiroseovarius sediminis]MCI2394802.1 hypothetical protein [Aliiroseovarius sediminis]
MPLPIAPIAAFAIRYGSVAVATYALARSIERAPRDQSVEDTLDTAPEGVTTRRDDEQMNATARMRRVIRLGTDGPGIEIDAVSLTRIRFRKV